MVNRVRKFPYPMPEMIRLSRVIAIAVATLAGFVGQAQAQEARSGFDMGRFAGKTEIRGGISAIDTGPLTTSYAEGVGVNAEVVFPSSPFLAVLGSPRPYVGADVTSEDDGANIVYGGMNWQTHVGDRLYLGVGVGGSVTDSRYIGGGDGLAKDLGSNLLFHLQASVGYDISDTLMTEVYLNHFSNAGIAEANSGLESTGVRMGYRF